MYEKEITRFNPFKKQLVTPFEILIVLLYRVKEKERNQLSLLADILKYAETNYNHNIICGLSYINIGLYVQNRHASLI